MILGQYISFPFQKGKLLLSQLSNIQLNKLAMSETVAGDGFTMVEILGRHKCLVYNCLQFCGTAVTAQSAR